MLIHLNTNLNRQVAKNNFNHAKSILFSTVLYDLPEGKLCINKCSHIILKIKGLKHNLENTYLAIIWLRFIVLNTGRHAKNS